MTTAPNMRQPGFETSAPSLPTYTSATISVPMTDRTPATMNPRLIGAIARLVTVGRADREHTDDRGEDADRPCDEREDETDHPLLRVVGVDRTERGDAEDDRRDQRDLVALEQVRGHARAVTDVVADVVGDRRRVPRVVLGDALLDLAHEVGADVGRLGEDAAAHPHEQRDEGPAEPEADEDRGAHVLEDHDDQGRAEQPEADREHPGDAAGPERHPQRSREGAGAGGGRGTDVAAHRKAHADEAGERGQEGAGDEGEGPVDPRLGERQPADRRDAREPGRHCDLGGRHEDDDRDRDQDHRDGAELTAEIRHRAFLDRLGDLDHGRRALIGCEHATHQRQPDDESKDGRARREHEPEPLGATELEELVTTFRGDADHSNANLVSGRFRWATRWHRDRERLGDAAARC